MEWPTALPQRSCAPLSELRCGRDAAALISVKKVNQLRDLDWKGSPWTGPACAVGRNFTDLSMPLLAFQSSAIDAAVLRASSSDCFVLARRDNEQYCKLQHWKPRRCSSWNRVKATRHGRRYTVNFASGNAREPPQSTSNLPFEWDPFEDLFGLGVDPHFREDLAQEDSKNDESDGPSVSELTCPTCNGRGYVECTRCNSTDLDATCPQCSGKGYLHCWSCQGQSLFPEVAGNESAWASLHSRLPSQIAEDEAIERVATNPAPKRTTRRVYGPLRPETKEKIRRALKDLEVRTGSISQRLKDQHSDPVLHAQRSAAIKKARSTDEARRRTSEKLKAYFSSEENRMKISRRMTGVPFTCSACGEKGHRRHFCPKLGFKRKLVEATVPSYHCSHCGQIGHKAPRCPELESSHPTPAASRRTMTLRSISGQRRQPKVQWCGMCHSFGHTKATCPNLRKIKKRSCSVCGKLGHNRRTCAELTDDAL